MFLPTTARSWLRSLVVMRFQISLPVVALTAKMAFPLVDAYTTFPDCTIEATLAFALNRQATLPGATFGRLNAGTAGLPVPACATASQPPMPSPAVAAPASAASACRRLIPAMGAVPRACRPPAARCRTVVAPSSGGVSPPGSRPTVGAPVGRQPPADGTDGAAGADGHVPGPGGACAPPWSSRAR